MTYLKKCHGDGPAISLSKILNIAASQMTHIAGTEWNHIMMHINKLYFTCEFRLKDLCLR